MNPHRWLAIVIGMGALLTLSPLSAGAQAWRHQGQAPRLQHRTPSPPQAYRHANAWHGQRAQGHALPRQHQGYHHQRPQGHHPQGHAYGWQHRGAPKPYQHGHAYGRHDRHPGWNRSPRGFAQDHRPGYGQFRAPDRGQPHNARFPAAHADYRVNPRTPGALPPGAGYPHQYVDRTGRTSPPVGFHHNGAAANPVAAPSQVVAEVIPAID